ncbi:CAP domain-containing protein [Erysipelothrix rhusiopathiae]|uniref:CAP domain-containing protein n=1 Tax=Erysipelothrix rhusiopathiae TaxID=1648 RepID=UPI001CB917F1|nr:CAP domain-containing protein [Erysipelothrix rhusiopathiae]
MNANRRAKGLSNLTWSNSLYNSAQIRAKRFQFYLNTPVLMGQSVLAMANDSTVRILYIRIDMDFLVNLWMNFSGHYGNIMNDFKYTATAV